MDGDRPVALVTGGSRGIGRAVVLRLAADGHDVAFCFRSRSDAADATAKEASAAGARVLARTVDVADAAAVRAFVEEVEGDLGPIAVAVTCAGITRDTPLVRMEEDAWSEVIDTNLGGTYHVARAVVFSFMKRRAGTLVTMSSVSGQHGNAMQSNYAASKAGIIGFTLSMARECGRYGVRANAVVPGFIDTEMTEQVPERIRDDVLGRIPLGRVGTADEVADLVGYLASDRSSYVTGQVLGVNGGLVV